MIYMAIITWERPQPTLHDAKSEFSIYHRQILANRSPTIDMGCVFPNKGAPHTCANVLGVNRQVNHELTEMMEHAGKKNLLFARIDCIAGQGHKNLFTWLSLPLVRTKRTNLLPRAQNTWSPNISFPGLGRLFAPRPPAVIRRTTTIEQLRVDVRFVEDNSLSQSMRERASAITKWAICEALRRILDRNSGYLSPSPPDLLTIDTLILNIAEPFPSSTLPRRSHRQPHTISTSPTTAEYRRQLTQDLTDVWNDLWSSEAMRIKPYRVLLERIRRVKICVDGKLLRERELRLELERGRQERRRIAARVGW